MPSWNDGETSSGSLVSGFSEGQDISPRPPVPESIFDPDYTGSGDIQLRCKHDMPLHKFVAFEGADTGRKFLGCGCEEEGICDTVHWIDGEWPSTLKHYLTKLWAMYEDEKDTRISGNVEYATKNYQLVLEKRELEKQNIQLHKQLGNTLTMEQVAKVTSHELELEKAARQKAEQQVCSLKEEKRRLEFYIADLLKVGEDNKNKLKQISEICGE